jgi:phosphatidylserine/phosphatidylglycerophosphate/cardiolipin synthase-like enzyme
MNKSKTELGQDSKVARRLWVHGTFIAGYFGNLQSFSGGYRARRQSITAALLLLPWLFFVLALAGCQPHDFSIPQGVEVFFSPNGGCTRAVVSALDSATNSVFVQAYSFTSAPIAKALVSAHERKVKVRMILDDSQRTEKYSEADFLDHYGVAPLIDSRHAIAHNKIMIIDEALVITGSFNFTKAAEEKNAENLLIIHDPILAKKYLQNWSSHETHAEAFHRSTSETPKPKRPRQPTGKSVLNF